MTVWETVVWKRKKEGIFPKKRWSKNKSRQISHFTLESFKLPKSDKDWKKWKIKLLLDFSCAVLLSNSENGVGPLQLQLHIQIYHHRRHGNIYCHKLLAFFCASSLSIVHTCAHTRLCWCFVLCFRIDWIFIFNMQHILLVSRELARVVCCTSSQRRNVTFTQRLNFSVSPKFPSLIPILS